MHPKPQNARPSRRLRGCGGAVWMALGAVLLFALPAWSAQVTEVRVGRHPEFTRVVFELDGPAGYRMERAQGAHGPELRVTLDAAARAKSIPFRTRDITRVDVEAGRNAVAHIALQEEGIRVKEMILTNPPRIVLDVMRENEVAVARKPKPAPKPKPEPQAVKPAPAPKPVAETKPAPAPKPVAETKPAPKPKPEPQAVKPAPAPKPVAETKPAPAPKPVAETKPEPEPQAVKPAPAPKPVAETKPESEMAKATPDSAADEEPAEQAKPAPLARAGAKTDAPDGESAPREEKTPEAADADAKAEPGDADALARADAAAPKPKPLAPRQAAKPEAARPAPAKPEQTAAADGMGDWMGRLTDPVMLGAAGGLLLCVVGLVLLRRRRRPLPNDLDVTAIADEPRTPGEKLLADSPLSEPGVAESGSALEGLFDDEPEPGADPASQASPASPEPSASASTFARPAAGGGAEERLFDMDDADPNAATTMGDSSMNQSMSDLPADPDRPSQASAGRSSAAPDTDVLRVVHELERRMAQLESKLEAANEARERLERQVAAQSEELRVQRAAIARTQRALRTMSRGDEDKATEPALRDGDTQTRTRVAND